MSSVDQATDRRRRAVVYHYSSHVHFDIDYLRGDYAWFLGEKQVVNFLSTGMTVTW